MAGTPEEDLLGWLEREEESLGFSTFQDALGDIERARSLLYDELGYDITEAQFEALTGAAVLRYEELPSIGVSYMRYEHAWGYQDTYRDIATGRFVSGEDVFSLLSVIRGT
jgi:predicted Ser/Thr protein kinase